MYRFDKFVRKVFVCVRATCSSCNTAKGGIGHGKGDGNSIYGLRILQKCVQIKKKTRREGGGRERKSKMRRISQRR